MNKLIKNKVHRKIFFSVVAIISLMVVTNLFFVAVRSANFNTSASASDRQAIVVQTKKLLPETILETVSTSAVTKSFEKVEVFPEANGKIAIFYCSEGKYVRKGQIIASLETDQSLLTNLKNAKTNLKIAKENKKNVERLQKQLKKDTEGTSSEKSTKKQAELAIDIAKGQVKIAQGQIDNIQSRLDKYLIKAPISGFVSQINLDKGDLAVMTAPIATISNSKKIKIETAITEFDVPKIIRGQKVKVKLASYPNREFMGEVYYVSSVADSVSKKFPVKIQLENQDGKIKDGMVAEIKIVVGKQENILIIPKSSVFNEEGIEKVYVLENSRIKIKTIKTEPATEDKLKVVSGLSVGEELVLNGNYDLKEGDLVKVNNH